MSALATSPRISQLVKGLPAFSPVAIKLMALIADENVSFKEVSKLFALDPVLSGQVLQLANSGLYARQSSIHSILHAIALLGLRNISRIAITAALANGLARRTSPWMRNWWRHSIASAMIADHVGVEDLDVDLGYTAGLLHAMGQLALFQQSPAAYPVLLEDAYRQGVDVRERECERFGVDHAELSGMILDEWGLPSGIQRAVSEYYEPNTAEPLTVAVQTGCFYAESLGFGQCCCPRGVGNNSPGEPAKPLDKYLLDVLAIEVNRIECSLV